MKRCASCGIEKTCGEFHARASAKDGLHSYCKPCTRAKNAAWVRANREKHRETCATWYAKNKPKANATQSCWHYRKSYGITKKQFLELVSKAKGKCQICSTELDIGSKASNGAVLDHCHNTGAIRGVLCNACNKGIGHFADSVDRLSRAIAYLSEAA